MHAGEARACIEESAVAAHRGLLRTPSHSVGTPFLVHVECICVCQPGRHGFPSAARLRYPFVERSSIFVAQQADEHAGLQVMLQSCPWRSCSCTTRVHDVTAAKDRLQDRKPTFNSKVLK